MGVILKTLFFILSKQTNKYLWRHLLPITVKTFPWKSGELEEVGVEPGAERETELDTKHLNHYTNGLTLLTDDILGGSIKKEP